MLLEADPKTFAMHPHYRNAGIILVHAGRIDPDWTRARLLRTWREMAPRRWLKEWDGG